MILDGEISVHIPNPECRDFKRRHDEEIEERKWQLEVEEQTRLIENQIVVQKKWVLRAEVKLAEKVKTINHTRENSMMK